MKKVLAVITAVLCALCVTACSSSVSVYYQTVNSTIYYVFAIDLDEQDKTAIEVGSTYSVDSYFEGLCKLFPDTMEFMGVYTPDRTETEKYLIQFALIAEPSEDGDSEPDENYSVKLDKGFIMNKAEITQSNPLSGYVAAYDDPSEGSLLDVIVNGVRDGENEVYPAITEAFPALKNMNREGLKLQFFMEQPKLLVSTDGDREIVDGVRFVKWQCILGEDIPETITYAYYYPNSVGWCVVLAVAAIVVVLILWLVARRKPDDSRLVDARGVSERALERTVTGVKGMTESGKIVYTVPVDPKDIDPFEEKDEEQISAAPVKEDKPGDSEPAVKDEADPFE